MLLDITEERSLGGKYLSMVRVGSKRKDPNIQIFDIPGTDIGFPTDDPTGIIPDVDITDDPEICSELEQIPLSGVSCDGSAPVYFKYLVSEIGCYECIERRLMPLNITFSRICYKMNPCPDKEKEIIKEELPEMKPEELPSDQGGSSNVFIIEDENNPFPGWDSEKTYTGTIRYRLVWNYSTNWQYWDSASGGVYVCGEFSDSSVRDGEFPISWQGKPNIRTETTYTYTTSWGSISSKIVMRQAYLNNIKLLYEYRSLDAGSNTAFNLGGAATTTVECEGKVGSYHISTQFLEVNLTVSSVPPYPIPEREKPMDCCSCADIRLMLERQKKDIFKYIDESKIDYDKITYIVNQLGVNITQVNFDLSKQIKEFNENNFVGIAANIGIINQTVIELTNSIIATSNENTFFITSKIESFNTEIVNNFSELTEYISNYFPFIVNLTQENIIKYIGVVIGRLEIDFYKKIEDTSVVVIREITEEIILSYSNLVKFISLENISITTYTIESITVAISTSVQYAIKVIIEEILKNRAINATNFFNVTKNIQEYLALLLLQIAFEIKAIIGGLKIDADTNLIVNNIVTAITPIINNSFQTNLPDIVNNVTNDISTTIGDKVENCCNGIVDLLNLILNILALFRDNGVKCPDVETNNALVITLLNNLFNKIETEVNDLESNLSIKLDNLDLDFTALTNTINNNNEQLKINIVNEIKSVCSEVVNGIKTDLNNLFLSYNKELINHLNQLSNLISTQNSNSSTLINNQLTNLVTQIKTLQDFNTTLLENITNFQNSNNSSFSEILSVLAVCCQMIQTEFYNNNQFVEQKVVVPFGGLMSVVSTILNLLTAVDTLIKNKEDSKTIIEIRDKIDKVEKLIDVEISGNVSVNCGANSLSTQYGGKTFGGLSNQLKSITQVLKLIVDAVCIEISGSVSLDCNGELTTQYFLGTGVAGISDQLKAISGIQTVIGTEICKDTDDRLMQVLYPVEKLDHLPLKSQLQIYFGLNYPKATGTLLPVYIPSPRIDLSWQDFDGLIRFMGQLYVHLEWDSHSDLNAGLWGNSEEHLTEIANKLIALSTRSATLRFTKGGRRKRPIIERQLRAVRAVLSIIDDNGYVTETKCYLPPK